MNKLRYILRDGNVDGTSVGSGVGAGAGAGPAPSIPTPQAAPSTPAAPSKSQTDVWGGQPAPDWMKANALGKVHDKANEVAGVPTQTEDDSIGLGDPVVPATTTIPAQPATSPAVVPMAQPNAVLPPDVISKVYADAYKQAAEQMRPPATQGGQPQGLSEAQLAQQLGVFEATDVDYEAAFGVKPSNPAQLQAYNKHLQNIAKQAVTVGQILVQRQLDERQAQVAPYIAAIKAQEAERQRTVFFTEHADLKGYEPLVTQAYQVALASGQKFPNADVARKFIADKTRETLKLAGITPTAARTSTTTTPAAPPQTATRKMTTTSVGGRSGGSATTGKVNNNMEAVWGKK